MLFPLKQTYTQRRRHKLLHVGVGGWFPQLIHPLRLHVQNILPSRLRLGRFLLCPVRFSPPWQQHLLMGSYRFDWPRFSFLRLTGNFRRCHFSRRSLVVVSVCVVYLVFEISQVKLSRQHRDQRTDKRPTGLDRLGFSDKPVDQRSFVLPTRSNVVYITLRSKRLKPANIRATIRPKQRRKVRRNTSGSPAFTRSKLTSGHVRRSDDSKTSWRETWEIDYKSGVLHTPRTHPDSLVSSIRIYSQKAPPWFSAQDVSAMRFLADAKVLRIKEVSLGDSQSLLMFEGQTNAAPDPQTRTELDRRCGGRCGVLRSPVDTSEVFAFHLDRVLGLNRTLPAVSRRFGLLHGGSELIHLLSAT